MQHIPLPGGIRILIGRFRRGAERLDTAAGGVVTWDRGRRALGGGLAGVQALCRELGEL